MDNFNQSGIAVKKIKLVRANIDTGDPDGERKYNIRLTDLVRNESEDKYLNVFAAFDIMHDIENPPFKFTCVFFALYERGESSMEWKDFSSAMALAHIIPYLREFVSNMTNRLPVPVLMIDPINTHSMIEAFNKHQQQVPEVLKLDAG